MEGVGQKEMGLCCLGEGRRFRDAGAELVHSKGWVCGLEADVTSSMSVAVFCLKMGKQPQGEGNRNEKYDLINRILGGFFFNS